MEDTVRLHFVLPSEHTATLTGVSTRAVAYDLYGARDATGPPMEKALVEVLYLLGASEE